MLLSVSRDAEAADEIFAFNCEIEKSQRISIEQLRSMARKLDQLADSAELDALKVA